DPRSRRGEGRAQDRRRARALVRVEPAEGCTLGGGSVGGSETNGRAAMNYAILDALSQITREKSVDRALLVETLEQGLASAVRKKYGATADVEAKFANETGAISVAIRKTVVENIEDPALQLTLEEARAY